jgi:hypothetical protein
MRIAGLAIIGDDDGLVPLEAKRDAKTVPAPIMSARLDTLIRQFLAIAARLNREADWFSLKTVSGREDRWREFGFDGYSRERFRREIVIERCPLERDSYRDRRGRKGGHR